MYKCLLFLGDIGGGDIMLLMLVVGPVLLIVHFIPSLIARKRPDFFMVLLVNIVAGWSVIGWLAALYLALRKVPPHVLVNASGHAAAPGFSVADELGKLRDLRSQGVLTEAEFERQKNLLLS